MALIDEIRNLKARQSANNDPRRGASPKPMNPRVAASLNLPRQATNISLEQAIQGLAPQPPSGGGRQVGRRAPIEFQQLRDLQAAQERAQRAAQMTGGNPANPRGLPTVLQQPGALQSAQERAQRAAAMFAAQQQPMPLANQYTPRDIGFGNIPSGPRSDFTQLMPGQFTGVPFGSMPTGNPYPQRGVPIGFQNPAMLQDAQERAIRAGGQSGFMNSFGSFGQSNMTQYGNGGIGYPMGYPMQQPVGGGLFGQPMTQYGNGGIGYPMQQPNMGQQYAMQQPNMNQQPQNFGNAGFSALNTNMGQQQQPQSANDFDSFAYRPL